MRVTCPMTGDQFPVVLIAQVVKHCTGIAEVLVQIPFRPKFFSGFNFTTEAVCITAMINHVFISFSAVQIYDISYILFYYMEESVLLGTKPLVDSIRHFIRDPSGVFSVCHRMLWVSYRSMTSRFPPFAFVEMVSPYNKKNITRWLGDMNFMFFWQEPYLTRT